MPGIYLMAAITVALGVALWGGLLYVMSGRQVRYLWLVGFGLPLSAVGNLWVKRPLAVGVADLGAVASGLGSQAPAWYLAFLLLLSPLAEEAIKVAPLLLPWAHTRLGDATGALWTGTALGLGFGLGEAAFIAHGIAQDPRYRYLPWHAFGGYQGERLIACFLHAGLTALVVGGLRSGPLGALSGYLLAVALHALANTGAFAYQLGLVPSWLAQLSLVAALLILGWLYERLRRRALTARPDAAGQEVVYFQRQEPPTGGS